MITEILESSVLLEWLFLLASVPAWLSFASWTWVAAAAAKSLQSCPSLCDPTDGSPPGSPVPGILQARTLEWVVISFSNAWRWKVKVKSLSRVWLPATPWTAAYQAPPSMGFFQARVLEWVAIAFSELGLGMHLGFIFLDCQITLAVLLGEPNKFMS